MHSRNNDVNIYVYIMRHIFCCIGVRNFLKFSGSKKKICQTYFEIGQTYFKISQTYFARGLIPGKRNADKQDCTRYVLHAETY